jgi:catechol 2,3-dioxygenase-like lactoylglutathione lyase family enzyme
MTLEIIEINHFQTTVPSASEEASKHFYGRVLGLEEIPKPTNLRSRGGAWYRQGAVQLHLSIEDPGKDNGSSRRHVCFVVADLDEAERTMRESGVEIIRDNQPMDGWRRFYVRDPGGNRIEIAQRVGAAGK